MDLFPSRAALLYRPSHVKSSQLRFFITDADERNILQDVMEHLPFMLVKHASRSNRQVEPIGSTLPPASETRQILLARPGDFDQIQAVSADDGSLHVVQKIHSPVIEFERSLSQKRRGDGLQLTKGRLWVSFDHGEGTMKDLDFCDWARAVFRRFKKHLSLIEAGDWIGPDAQRLLQENRVTLSPA
jgi:hypothetical protein